MPRYYFDAREHDIIAHDPDGVELPDLEAARHEAILGARELMSSVIMKGQPPDGRRFIIRDEEGRVVLEVPFADAIKG